MLQQKSNGVTLPKVGIVTLNWNGLKHLKYFLPTVSNQTYNNFFTIVVDNGSNDDSIKFINRHYPRVEVMDLKHNYGYSKGFNKGINLAIKRGAEYILISNNDVLLHEDILSVGVSLFQKDSEVGYMSGKVYHMNDKHRFQYAGGRIENKYDGLNRGAMELDIGQYEKIEYFDYMDDVCILVKTKMIEEIGSYDEDFFFDYEETEWNHRIRKNKFKIVYNPKMKIWHRIHGHSNGVNYTPFTFFYHWRGKILFMYKTKSGSNQFYSLLFQLFIDIPVKLGILIKNNNSYLIPSLLKGILSAFKRIVQL